MWRGAEKGHKGVSSVWEPIGPVFWGCLEGPAGDAGELVRCPGWYVEDLGVVLEALSIFQHRICLVQ